MNEDGDIVLDSLPYADQELDLAVAEAEIRKELKRSRKPDFPDFELFENPTLSSLFNDSISGKKINAIDVSKFKLPEYDDPAESVRNAMAQLEYQQSRKLNLDLIGKFSSNQWKLNVYQLQKLVESMESEKTDLEERITMINKERKRDQLNALKTFENLKEKQKDLLDQIFQIRLANHALEKQSAA